MIQTILIIFLLVFISLALYSLAVKKSKQQRWQARLRRVRAIAVNRYSQRLYSLNSGEDDEELEELHSYFVGEISCKYNARSPYIRCAVNPCGPCENCIHYESRYKTKD